MELMEKAVRIKQNLKLVIAFFSESAKNSRLCYSRRQHDKFGIGGIFFYD